MESTPEQTAWLESSSGGKTGIEGTCYIGRSTNNTVVLPKDKVSRRHAMIHLQDDHEYWLVDLGSSNGSYLNGRRIAQPGRLASGDRIEIGGNLFYFRRSSQMNRNDLIASGDSDKTIQDIKSEDCWLMVADIQGSTEFIQKMPPEEAPKVTATWLTTCRQIIEKQQGTINKFLGDGFFAFWIEKEGTSALVRKALNTLQKFQARGNPRFRMVLHKGKVFLGGEASMGEESLMGNEVNFVFRMEKVAASMGVGCLISEPAGKEMKILMPLGEASRESVPGFDGDYLFYSPNPEMSG